MLCEIHGGQVFINGKCSKCQFGDSVDKLDKDGWIELLWHNAIDQPLSSDDEDQQWTAKYWTANQTECTECNRIIDTAGQCDCDFDPIWWDTQRRRYLPTNTKADEEEDNDGT